MGLENRLNTFGAAGSVDMMAAVTNPAFVSQLRTAPVGGAAYAAGMLSTTVTDAFQIFSGSRLVAQGPVPGGGTVGVYPLIPDNIQFEWVSEGGEEVSIQVTAGAASSVMLTIQREP